MSKIFKIIDSTSNEEVLSDSNFEAICLIADELPFESSIVEIVEREIDDNAKLIQ